MYMLYIDHVLFPVAPEKIVIETENENREIELIDGSRIVSGRGKKLRRFTFDLLLPQTSYPFAMYEDGFKEAGYYLDVLNKIAEKNEPVWFDVYRNLPDINKSSLTNVKVLMEKLTQVEEAEYGRDIIARVVLKEFKSFETKIVDEKVKDDYIKREDTLTVPYTYTVKDGDSLWRIAKLFFDNGEMYTYLAKINNIKSPYVIYKGQEIKLRE